MRAKPTKASGVPTWAGWATPALGWRSGEPKAIVVGQYAASFGELKSELLELSDTHDLTLVPLFDQVDAELAPFVLDGLPVESPTRRKQRGPELRRRVIREANRMGRELRVARALLGRGPAARLVAALGDSDDVVIALDSVTRRNLSLRRLPSIDASGIPGLIFDSAAQRRSRPSNLQTKSLLPIAEKLRELPTGHPYLPPPQVWAIMAWRMIRESRFHAARQILRLAEAKWPTLDASHGWAILRHLLEARESAHQSPSVLDAARRTMAAADAAHRAGEAEQAYFLLQLVLETLLCPEVQTNVPDASLVRDPDALLSPLRASEVWSHLSTTPAARRQRPSRASETHAAAPALVLAGAYPKFHHGVVKALSEAMPTDVVSLGELDKRFSHLALSPREVRERLRRAEGQDVQPDELLAETFKGREYIFIDWCDKGALAASMWAPREARLVIRFHGADTLQGWQLLVDWSRIDALVFTSKHLQSAVNATLGAQITDIEQHVVGNLIDFDRFQAPKSDDAMKVLGMVGWAQKVKDPLWALDVLARLRQDDESWRLRLIGSDFPTTRLSPSENRFARAYRERAMQLDVLDAIEYTGFTRHLEQHVAGVGFGLSTSLREGFHVGAAEMAAAGAVPVVRNWPVYARYDAARQVFGDEWVVDTVPQAVDRILSLSSDVTTWRAASDEARTRIRTLMPRDDSAARIRQIVLGR